MNTQQIQTIVTVTTAPGRPTIKLVGAHSRADIAKAVRQRFGYHLADAAVPAIPHSFCATQDPAPVVAGPPCGDNGRNYKRPANRRWAGC